MNTNANETDCWVGFDLGGTKMLATVFDAAFQPLGRERKKTRGHEGADAGLERIAAAIETVLEEQKIDRGRIRGIGMGVPGPIDLERGVILDAPNLGWSDVPLRDFMEERFGCPVVIANDVDSGVYGEYRFGAARGARCVVGVFPGTGIGGGCVYEGRILRGKHVCCLEIGHVQVLPGGPRCGCGQIGCLEAVASRLAISAAAAQAAFRGQAPHLRKECGCDVEKIRSGALAESIANGDAAVEDIVRCAVRHIGVAVGNLVHLLAPDVIVLGGGLVEALPELFVDGVWAAARENVMPAYKQTFEVHAAELGDDATVMGAAAWAREIVSPQSAQPQAASPA
ncbi:MAG: ROK family protein [Planctomycetaceae bacterium]